MTHSRPSTFFDLTVVGSGFGGSLLAMAARRLGLSVLLLERGRHPRFAIGESTSPLANLLLEDFSRRFDLPRLLPLTSFGAWQRAYPRLGCGLKRGFTFYHHAMGQSHRADRRSQLRVAASPNDDQADTHWLRADVDEFLMREAADAGADYRDGVTLDAPQWDKNGTARLTGARKGQPFTAQTRLLVDATGPRGFLARTLNIEEVTFADYPATQALFSHFRGACRCDDLPEFDVEAGRGETPPYPPDAAAVHHVFDGGWMWALRFGSGVTSAGIAVTDALAAELGLADGAAAWQRFLARFPGIAAQFDGAEAIRPFVHAPRLAYRAARAAGPGWALLPSAAAFVDPLFSTGIPLTLLGIERLADVLEHSWGRPDFEPRLREYGETTLAEADATADFIGGCYAAMPSFPVFTALSMFYFAAASYAEMARRLDVPSRPRRFLAADHSKFGPALRRHAAWARSCLPVGAALAAFEAQAAEAVACLNVAGLCDPNKRNWYGVDWEDVIAGAEKLGKTPAQMRAILRKAPWAQPGSGG